MKIDEEEAAAKKAMTKMSIILLQLKSIRFVLADDGDAAVVITYICFFSLFLALRRMRAFRFCSFFIFVYVSFGCMCWCSYVRIVKRYLSFAVFSHFFSFLCSFSVVFCKVFFSLHFFLCSAFVPLRSQTHTASSEFIFTRRMCM